MLKLVVGSLGVVHAVELGSENLALKRVGLFDPHVSSLVIEICADLDHCLLRRYIIPSAFMLRLATPLPPVDLIPFAERV